jgi:hypothetical protein
MIKRYNTHIYEVYQTWKYVHPEVYKSTYNNFKKISITSNLQQHNKTRAGLDIKDTHSQNNNNNNNKTPLN